MKQRGLVVWSAWVLLAVTSCSPEPAPLTQVMVVVDSDMAAIDAVRVRVQGMGEEKRATASDLDDKPLPRSVAVVHDGGPLGPIVVTAEGLSDGKVVVAQQARLSFVEGRNMMLRLELSADCAGMRCSDGEQTCVAGDCRSYRVDGSDLDDWPGAIPRDAGADGDAGVMEAGKGGTSGRGGAGGTGTGARGGVGGGGRGGAGGAGTGGMAGMLPAGQGGAAAGGGGGATASSCDDCRFDVESPHGALSCEDGVCDLRCDAGFADADDERSNGCEVVDFGWATSNFDPNAASWMPVIADELRADCNATIDFGSAGLPATADICGHAVSPMLHAQANGGPEVVVLATRHLVVEAGRKLRFAGARPVLIVVYGDAEIDGELDVSAIGTSGAAGSNYACNTGAGGVGQSGGTGSGGGGGGGFGTPGAKGADSVTGRTGGAGGVPSANSTLRPLRGGCVGGTGGQDEGSITPGGAGGGALQLSVVGRLRVTGTIAAAGGAGARGASDGDGGGGGGSGGALLLEAGRIETVGGAWITVNGGGGGAGRHYATSATLASDGAHASSAAAKGGDGNGAGGYGAAAGVEATAGSTPVCGSVSCGAGGGGGGAGRIVLHASECVLSGSMSPLATCTPHP